MTERASIAPTHLLERKHSLTNCESSDRSAPLIESDAKIKPSPVPAVLADIASGGVALNPAKTQSNDRSAPIVDDAAHPGSAATLRAIAVAGVVHGVGFDLKRPTSTADRSAPIIEQDTKIKSSPARALVAELNDTQVVLASTKTNDRSAPQVPSHPTQVTLRPPPQKAVVAELAAKRDEIEEAAASLARQSVSGLTEEGLVRHSLVAEVKEFSSFVQQQSAHLAERSVPELQKHTRPALVDELKKKRPSIEKLAGEAALKGMAESYRTMGNPSLVNEIKLKQTSIDALTHLHRTNSAELTAGGPA